YRAMVMTNLTPEHIEAHGGFEAYKQAKLKALRVLEGKRGVFSVVNLGADFVEEFATVDVETVVGFGRDDKPIRDVLVDRRVVANNIRMGKEGTDAEIDGERVHIPLLGSFSFENALAAIATVVQLGYALPDVLLAAQSLQPIPGRLERFPFKGGEVIVDYAPEPYALNALYDVVNLLKPIRIIHVFGSCGGGRDVARRAVMGCMASEQDDVVIVTNEDPYDDDPLEIINAVADAAAQHGKKDGVDLFRVLDREEAIQKAVEMAREGDLVLVTGKGSEPVMAVAGGKKVPSDDREFVRRALAKKSV
ncbi:hypothetical protein HYV72_00035, partial [Candidatus Uhrbacteria bacterium]|nr:hypothetical protein [Candidatus Uhrbacteria bacterium]